MFSLVLEGHPGKPSDERSLEWAFAKSNLSCQNSEVVEKAKRIAHCGDRTHDLPIAMAVKLLRVGCSTNGAQRAKPSWLFPLRQ
jgi:hypothetical protein